MNAAVKRLRQKHPVIIYRSYTWRVTKKTLHIAFDFYTEPDIHFTPTVKIRGVTSGQLARTPKATLDNLVFHLGLIELLSYWKATCSPHIRIEAGALNAHQRRWWINLLHRGMGEFFYVNRIDPRTPNLVTLKCTQSTHMPHSPHRVTLKNRTLVPVGGGKDSAVTLDIFKRARVAAIPLVLNPTRAARSVIRIAGYPRPIIIQRTIDPRLLALNKQGYLNGHTPFSAYLAFLSVLVATLFDYRYIALSNEQSANEGNVRWRGTVINHQYSKSFSFEKAFDSYARTYLASNVHYFSFLRPINELQIAALFARMKKYHRVFRSCNRGSKENRWCGRCPKCIFTDIILSPFLSHIERKKIFGATPADKSYNAQTVKQLAGLVGHKPFECVGTKKEVRAALSGRPSRLLHSWNKHHNLPAKFEHCIQTMIHKDSTS